METFPRHRADTVTIQDVARRAGCAISTVSRVLNGSPRTSPETRARVMEAVATLEYQVNAIGRSLKTKQTRALGVLIPSITNPVFASSLSGIEEAARAEGFDIIVTTSNYDPGRDEEAVGALFARGVEGALLTVADPDEWTGRALLDRAGLPHVLLYNQPADPQLGAVTVDNMRATADLTAEALRLGHSRIGYVSGRFGSSDRARKRYAGYCEAMHRAGLAARPPVEVPFVGTDDAFTASLSPILAAADRPTALLCSNDLLAIRVIAAARALGVAVPDGLSVAGFDGIDIGRMIAPSLATVEQPAEEMGRAAVGLLLAVMSGRRAPATILMPHRFRPGGSLSCVPAEESTGAPTRAPAADTNGEIRE